MDFEVSLQKFHFCSVSMRVHRGYSCNELMLLAASKLPPSICHFPLEELQRTDAACGIETFLVIADYGSDNKLQRTDAACGIETSAFCGFSGFFSELQRTDAACGIETAILPLGQWSAFLRCNELMLLAASKPLKQNVLSPYP